MDVNVINDLLPAIRSIIGLIGALVICFGAIQALYHFFIYAYFHKFDTATIRLELGNSIILGLEFIVGADIIGSLVSPNYYNLGLLGIIVVIRIILSFFLSRELRALSPESNAEAHKL